MGYAKGFGIAQQVYNVVTPGVAAKAGVGEVTEPSGLTAAGLTAGEGAAGDNVKLSASGSTWSQAMAGSDVRMDKVMALQGAIAAGTYGVSSADVADKLMRAMLG